MAKKFNEISVIIPIYRDEKRLKNNLPKIRKYLENNFKKFEIIIALDPPAGNTEKTAKNIFKNIKIIKNKKRMGKGYSIKEGMLKAVYSPVLFIDIDLSTPVEEIEILLPYLKNNHVIIGSRNMQESKIKERQPFLRSALGNIYPYLVRLLVIKDIRDTQCGFKLFRKDILKPVFSLQRIGGFAFDSEILLIAKKRGYKIKEVPVEWSNSKDSRLNIFKDSLRMAVDVIKIFTNTKRGFYNGD
ncbi:MAG: glycosyltransferase [Candidatus Aenigmarchaeota archaeon]|nr:glycosyltransferase [Candidatus Aenigmarchaeota archaeon]